MMADSENGEMVDVLLVEDDAGDALIVREALEHYRVRNTLHVVTDGEQALRFVRRTGEFTGAPRPGMIMLDLNLPRRDGMEVLSELKADPDLRVIPVVILTTSRSEEDVLRSYSLHANAYVTKPVEFEQFMGAVRQIDDFFINLVRLPG
jgi:CheY-like chemotaxis protein